MTRWMQVPSPVGELTLGAEGGSLTHVRFVDDRQAADRPEPPDAADGDAADLGVLEESAHQLAEYFAGDRQEFDLPLTPHGSDFQLRVWCALREIPYGTTTTYGGIARRLDLPVGSARAVGLANGANPLAIVVPCHRVIGSDGGLTGFSGGIERKERLLALEGAALF